MFTTVVDATRSLTQTLSLTPLPLLGSACPALSSRDRDTRHYPDYTLLHNSWRTALPADYKQEYRSSLLLLLLLHLWRWTFRNAQALTDRGSRTFSHFKRMGTLYQKPRRCLDAPRHERPPPTRNHHSPNSYQFLRPEVLFFIFRKKMVSINFELSFRLIIIII